MKIRENLTPKAAAAECRCLEIRKNGEKHEIDTWILQEHHMEVFVNGQFWTLFSCTPEYLTEAILGHLKTEGLIHSLEDVESVELTENGQKAMVRISVPLPSGLPDQYTKTPHPLTPIDWKPEWIISLADRLVKGMPLHEKTWGAHSCFLAQGEQLLFSCEDIGRHNAIDKAVGYALRNGLSLEKCILYTSGRMPFDMTMKIIMAGIPVVAAKAIPMVDSVELAKKYRLTMICAARPDRMRVYTDFYHQP